MYSFSKFECAVLSIFKNKTSDKAWPRSTAVIVDVNFDVGGNNVLLMMHLEKWLIKRS